MYVYYVMLQVFQVRVHCCPPLGQQQARGMGVTGLPLGILLPRAQANGRMAVRYRVMKDMRATL